MLMPFKPNFVRVGGETHLAIEPTYDKYNNNRAENSYQRYPRRLAGTAVNFGSIGRRNAFEPTDNEYCETS